MTDHACPVVTINPNGSAEARQGIPQFFGISGGSAGARGLSMNLTAFGPGGCAKTSFPP